MCKKKTVLASTLIGAQMAVSGNSAISFFPLEKQAQIHEGKSQLRSKQYLQS